MSINLWSGNPDHLEDTGVGWSKVFGVLLSRVHVAVIFVSF